MQAWDDALYLLTIEEYEQLPKGTILTSISGNNVIKGEGFFDYDTRAGYLAYGIMNPWTHPLKDLFLLFKLKE